MSEKQEQVLKELADGISSVTYAWSEYWKNYSGIGTWQLWVVLLFLLIPLLTLVFVLDRKKAYRLGFYGFSIHIFAIYSDLYGTTHKMWEFPYRITPFPAISFGLDASLIPVTYMLFYQWTLNRRKNYYLYLLLLSLCFAFIFKPLLSLVGLFWLYESTYLQLFLLYFVAGLLGKWLSDIFEWAESHARNRA